MAKVVFLGEKSVWIFLFSMSSFSGNRIDPQLVEMKTSQFIIAYPRIETGSIRKWLGYAIFQNEEIHSSCIEK